MTDLEKWKEFLDSFNIEYSVEKYQEALMIFMRAKTKNVAGYSGFETSVEFDLEGKFKEVAIYE